jgi:NADPH-dependent 2,4-dienoyl-CoA reductase/sulfur reductase-like enzyme
VEVLNLVSGQYEHVPLGTHANKHGRVIGHNVAGSYATFPGVVGTAVSKVYNLEIARTGLRERDAAQAGFGYVTVTIRSGTRAAYFPDTQRLTVKMTAEDLAYAPPFSPVWDPILVAARQASAAVRAAP